MSDTPRTDFAEGVYLLDDAVPLSFARELERELNAANARAGALEINLIRALAEVERLRERLDLLLPARSDAGQKQDGVSSDSPTGAAK